VGRWAGVRRRTRMGAMVQLAVARTLVEAEEMQTILNSAGIPSELEVAVDQHPTQLDDAPQKVLVPEGSLEDAQHAIEAMGEPDDLIED
jgi:hypothetical protein